MAGIFKVVYQAIFAGRHRYIYSGLLLAVQVAILIFYITFTSLSSRSANQLVKKSLFLRDESQKEISSEGNSLALESRQDHGVAHSTLKPSSSQQLPIMTGCPDDWPLEIVSRDQNGAPLIQVCRSIHRDGNWKCAKDWLSLEMEMKCILDPAAINRHGEGTGVALSFPQNRQLVKQPRLAPLSDLRKLLFIHIPKTGGTSIETSFLFDDRRKELGATYLGGHNKVTAFDEEFFKSYHKFCMVRHPCSRLISTWTYYSKNMGNSGDIHWAEKYMDENTRNHFDLFVKEVLYPDGPVKVNNQLHFQSQVDMIFHRNGSFALDQLLVFERWNESIEELGKRINTDVSALQLTHKLSSKHKSCREMYTPTLWKKLVELYAMDFCVLGYSTNKTELEVYPSVRLDSRELTKRYETCAIKLKSQNHFSKHTILSKGVNRNGRQKPNQANDFCDIFTYYEPQRKSGEAKLKAQNESLEAWKEGWSKAGWRPRVLSEDDARRHPEYMSLRLRFERLPTTNDKAYEMSCFLRHVAMAAVGGGWMSDIDVLPYHIPKCTRPFNRGEYTVYQLYTPSLVSANSTEYTRVATLMANIDWKNKTDTFSHNGKFHVSDMHVLRNLFEARTIKTMRVVMEASQVFKTPFTCERSLGYRATPAGMPKLPWAVHFSHSSMGAMRSAGSSAPVWPGSSWNRSFESFGIESSRGPFMKDAIEYLRDTCLLEK